MAMLMLNGFVLMGDIIKQEPDELSEGGIYTGKDKDRKFPAVGKVISVAAKMETNIAKGDQVVFMYNSSTSLTIDDKEFRMIGEKSLIGVVIPTGD